jgi:RND superfamily putative drug exporter
MLKSLARSVVRRPVRVILAWMVLLAAAAVPALRLGSVLQGGADAIPDSESDRVTRVLRDEFGAGALYQVLVVVRADSATVDDPEFIAIAGDVTTALEGTGRTRALRTYWNTGRETLLGSDRRSALLLVTPEVRTHFEAELLTATLRGAIARAHLPAGYTAKLTGVTAMLYDLDRHSSDDLLAAERIGLPITLVILLGVFGAPLAALLPLVLALFAVVVANAGLDLLSGFTPVSVFALNVVSMVGLGVGVDYALFILSHYRRERRRGAGAPEAIAAAVAGAGESVVFSGATVAVGFLALYLVRAPFLHAIALGGCLVVLTAVVASLTLLPAAIALAGPALEWPRRVVGAGAGGANDAGGGARDVAGGGANGGAGDDAGGGTSGGAGDDAGGGTSGGAGGGAGRGTSGGAWGAWAHLVMRRPLPFIALGVAVLALFIAPVARLQRWNIGARHLPASTEARQGYEQVAAAFGRGWMGPVVVVVRAPEGQSLWSAPRREAILTTARRLAADPRVARVEGFSSLLETLSDLESDASGIATLPVSMRPLAREVVTDNGRTAMLLALPRSDPESRETMALLADLRRTAWPEARAAGVEVRFGGASAVMTDFDAELLGSLPRVAGAVLLLTFVVLLVLFRSLLIPLKATVLNLLSVLAAYGFLVYVFQDGIGARLIGLDPPGGLNSFIVLMLFTILFGLSMDYEVFLLTRVRQAWRSGLDTRHAVAEGLEETAGTITSAALIMVSIFAAFGFTRLVATREFGLGLAFAVALDATLIRVVLVPALMVLAGERNWWPGRKPGTTARD